jgi:GNAT superfamily N-acetyltransferase
MDVIVRDATASDAGAVARLLACSPAWATTHGPRQRQRASRADLSAGVVGLVATHIVPRLDDDVLANRITDVVVSAVHRRSGIGSALMAAAEREAR